MRCRGKLAELCRERLPPLGAGRSRGAHVIRRRPADRQVDGGGILFDANASTTGSCKVSLTNSVTVVARGRAAARSRGRWRMLGRGALHETSIVLVWRFCPETRRRAASAASRGWKRRGRSGRRAIETNRGRCPGDSPRNRELTPAGCERSSISWLSRRARCPWPVVVSEPTTGRFWQCEIECSVLSLRQLSFPRRWRPRR